MEAIFEEHEKLSAKHNLARSVEDVQKTIDLLTKARDAIAASRSSPTAHHHQKHQVAMAHSHGALADTTSGRS
jgi:hypothetical protein